MSGGACYECGFAFDHQRLTGCPNCGTIPDTTDKLHAKVEQLRIELHNAKRALRRTQKGVSQ